MTNPKGWDTVYLKEFTTFLTSGSRGWSKYFADDGEMFLTIKNIKNCSISINNMQYIHAPKTKEAERTKVQARDLLISITADLGRTGVVTSDIADYGAYINQHISLVRLDPTNINPYFVSHFLETRAGKTQFESKSQVGVKAGLNFDAIGSLRILVPPLKLQTRFADFALQADKSKFIKMNERLIAISTYHPGFGLSCRQVDDSALLKNGKPLYMLFIKCFLSQCGIYLSCR